MRYNGTNLEEVLKAHEKYLDLCENSHENKDSVECLRANFSYAYVHDINFIDKNLTGANFERASISACKFLDSQINHANFKHCDFIGVEFIKTGLDNASFVNADFKHVFFGFSSCEGADFSGAKTLNVKIVNTDMAKTISPPFVPLACPEEGSFIGWKKGTSRNGCVIIKLLIPEDAKRSSATGRKCRASKAVVLDIQTIDGKHYPGVAYSMHNISRTHLDFEYHIGETVQPEKPFDEDRFEECASGIHFFITRQEAVDY